MNPRRIFMAELKTWAFLFAIIFYDSKMQEHERENPKDFTV